MLCKHEEDEKKKEWYHISLLSNMSKGMPNLPWNTLEWWMERRNLISFGSVLKISVIKIKHRTFGNTDGKMLQTAGKMNL